MNAPAPPPHTPPAPRSGRVARALRVLLVALVLAVGALLSSTRGLALLLHAWVPALEFSALEGSVLDGVTLHDARYASSSVNLSAQRFAVTWHASLRAGVVLREVLARELVVELAAHSPGTTPAWPTLPVAVNVERLRVEGLSIVQGGRRLQVAQVDAHLEIAAHAWTLRAFEMRDARQHVQGHARYAQGTLDAAFTADTTLTGAAAQLSLNLRGAPAALAVELQLQAPWPASLRGELNALATPPRFQGELAAQAPTIGAVRGTLAGDAAHLRMQLQLPLAMAAPALRDMQLDLRLARAGEGVGGPFTWQLGTTPRKGDGRLQIDARGLELALDSAAPLASLRGRWLFGAPGASIGARLRWQDVALPGTTPSVRSDGALRLRGRPGALVVDGALHGGEGGLGAVSARLHGELAVRSFELTHFEAALLDGSLRAHGTLDWQDQRCARLLFKFSGLDLAHFDAALASRLEGVGRARGCRQDDHWQGTLAMEHLAGRWRGQALRARGEFEATQAARAVRKLHVELGRNVLDADVELAPTLAGHYTLAAPELAAVWPGLAGSVEARGEVAGSVAAPLLRATIEGAALRVDRWQARSLHADLDLDAARGRASSLSLQLEQLTHGDRALGALHVQGQGSVADHALRFDLRGGALSAQLAARGAWSAPRWAGTVNSFSVEGARAGHWQLQDSAALAVEAAGVSFGPACLHERNARLCVNLPHWNGQAGAAQLHLSAVPLSLAQAWLPASLAPHGTVSADATLSHDAGGWQGDGEAHVVKGGVRYRTPGREEQDLPLRDAAARFHLAGERLRAEGTLELAPWLRVRATLDGGLAAQAPLRGELLADVPDIHWLEEFWPDLAGSSGSAQLKAQLSGVREAPQWRGELRLADGQVLLPRFGTELTALVIGADSGADHDLALRGEARLGAGTLRVQGAFGRRKGSEPRAELAVRGSQLAVVRLPDFEADAAPDMTVVLAPGLVQLRGQVTWSRVQIQLPTLPERAVASSPDELIVNVARGPQAPAPRRRWFTDTLAADLDFTLGDEVTLAAAGLDARLTGAVHWRKPQGDERGQGRGGFNIVSGHYKAYGQDLTIQRGALIFDGAIDNPALEVRAVRPELDVVAGVRVSGNLRVPKFALFAEPSLPDAEVLSYLVTGHALANASSGEAGVIARAALSLGADRAALVTSQLSNLFALDEFGINPGKTARTSSIVAGKRLTPKLTVRSEFNPFERVWSFFLNYKLSPRWSVEAQTGAGQGADVIYSVERDRLRDTETVKSDPAPLPPSP